MKITSLVLPTGHYLNIAVAGKELSVRTWKGQPEELLVRAEEMSQDAHRKLELARLYREAAAQLRETT